MPLTVFQRTVLRVLRPFRDEHDFVAGGAALNRNLPRLSDDLDIFHDLRDRLPGWTDRELRALREAGFGVDVTTRDKWMVEAIVRQYGFETRVQWMDEPETSTRFFAARFDDELGFTLHSADLAVNKTLAASRRREARDAVDVANIVRFLAPLGPLAWAASGKDAGLNPLRIIQDIRDRAFGFSDEQIRTVRMEDGRAMTRDELRETLAPSIDAALTYCEEVAPPEHYGCLFVDANERPVEADDHALAVGTARVMKLRDFGPMPHSVDDGS
jgi:hypothetical protein